MTRVLGLLLILFLASGCTSIPISHEAMQEPLLIIRDYDNYFQGLQRTSKMLGLFGKVDEEVRQDGITYSNAAYVYYIKAQTSLAEGNIKEFKVYMEAALDELKLAEEDLKEIMEEFLNVHPNKDGV